MFLVEVHTSFSNNNEIEKIESRGTATVLHFNFLLGTRPPPIRNIPKILDTLMQRLYIIYFVLLSFFKRKTKILSFLYPYFALFVFVYFNSCWQKEEKLRPTFQEIEIFFNICNKVKLFFVLFNCPK